MLKSLERAFREEDDTTTRFYISFLDDNPRPDAAVIQALNEGASRIVVAEVFVSVSNHTAEGKDLIEELDLDGIPVEMRFTGPLWDLDTLHSMFVERVRAHLDGTDKSQVGYHAGRVMASRTSGMWNGRPRPSTRSSSANGS